MGSIRNRITIIVMLFIFLMVLGACDTIPDNSSGMVSIDTKHQGETVESADFTDDDYKDKSIETESLDVDKGLDVRESETSNNNEDNGEYIFTTNKATSISNFSILENHKLSYKEYRPDGTLKNENAIREAIYFYGNHYYYSEYYDGYALMNIYDISQNEVIGSFTYPLVVLDPVYIEVDNQFFMAPCYYGESGELRIMFIRYDINNNTPQKIFDVAVTSPRVDIEKLDNDTILFFVYRDEDDIVVDTIYHYRISSNTLSVFYESYVADWSNPELTTKNIKLIETYGSKVYVLMDQMVNSKIKNYLDIYDDSGALVDSLELSVLEQYGDKKYRVWDMVCFGDYLYFDYDINNKNEVLSDYILIYNNNGDLNEIPLSDHCSDTVIYDGLLFDKYILLGTTDKEYDLLVVDAEMHSMTPVSFELESEYTIYPYNLHCNDAGDLIVIAEDQNHNNQQHLFTYNN